MRWSAGVCVAVRADGCSLSHLGEWESYGFDTVDAIAHKAIVVADVVVVAVVVVFGIVVESEVTLVVAVKKFESPVN